MQLTYRGSHYDVASCRLDMTETDVQGKYRGVPVRFKQSMGLAQPQAMVRLSYRGSDYLRFR